MLSKYQMKHKIINVPGNNRLLPRMWCWAGWAGRWGPGWGPGGAGRGGGATTPPAPGSALGGLNLWNAQKNFFLSHDFLSEKIRKKYWRKFFCANSCQFCLKWVIPLWTLLTVYRSKIQKNWHIHHNYSPNISFQYIKMIVLTRRFIWDMIRFKILILSWRCVK